MERTQVMTGRKVESSNRDHPGGSLRQVSLISRSDSAEAGWLWLDGRVYWATPSRPRLGADPAEDGAHYQYLDAVETEFKQQTSATPVVVHGRD